MSRSKSYNVRSEEERFRTKYVVDESGCWLWKAGCHNTGYGQFALRRSNLLRSLGQPGHLTAHRFSWILVHGPIPEGLDVCHKCDVKRCVNPDHLFLGTHQENMDDMARKGRRRFGTGRSAMYTLDDLEVIRWARACGMRTTDISKHLGVSPTTINTIVSEKPTYKPRVDSTASENPTSQGAVAENSS